MAAAFVPMPPGSEQLLNSTLTTFTDALQAYLPAMVLWGERMFTAVVFLGFGYAMIMAVVSHDWFRMIMSIGWAALRIGIIRLVFDNFIPWSGAFPTMGAIIGSDVSGISTSYGPSDIYHMGLHITSELFSALHWGEFFWHPIREAIFFPLLIVATQIIWFAAGLIYLWLIIELKWYLVSGAVPVAFSAFEHTFVVLENYFVTLLQVGIRLLVTMLVLGVGITLANGWIANLDARGFWAINSDQIGFGTIQLLGAVIFFYAMWSLPKKAAALVRSHGSSGDPHGGGGDAAMFAFTTSAITKAVSKAIRMVKG